MSDSIASWDQGVCNASAKDMTVWLEPWCDEFVLPPGGELSLRVEQIEDGESPAEFELTAEVLAIYGGGGTRLKVAIDGVEQDSCSAVMAARDFGPLSAKGFVDTVFGEFPEARPHGQAEPQKSNWLRGLFGRR
jgi:hypothetical protein